MKNNNNLSSKALNVVVKHIHQSKKRPNENLKRNINLGSLVIANPNLYRNEWHIPVRKRANTAMLGLAVKVASYEIPMRSIEPTLLRKLHKNAELSLVLAEHEYWHPETDPRDVEYYLKHSHEYLIGIGQEVAMTLPYLNEQQQTRIIKAALCGTRPFRGVGINSKYTEMGETLVNIWNMLQDTWLISNMFMEDELDEIRTRLMRAVLKTYRECFKPRSTIGASKRTANNAKAEINRLFASPLTTNTARNRATSTIRRVIASVPRSRLSTAAHALEMTMRDYERYLKTRYSYVDPFLSPYADMFKTILNSV